MRIWWLIEVREKLLVATRVGEVAGG